jgi:hypothetical protein
MAAAMAIANNVLSVVFMRFQTPGAKLHGGFEAGESM